MDREEVYEFIEEAGKREIMELLDAVINRFRELHEEYDLVVISLPVGGDRKMQLERVIEMLRREERLKKGS